jgi:hypothetical protein
VFTKLTDTSKAATCSVLVLFLAVRAALWIVEQEIYGGFLRTYKLGAWILPLLTSEE